MTHVLLLIHSCVWGGLWSNVRMLNTHINLIYSAVNIPTQIINQTYIHPIWPSWSKIISSKHYGPTSSVWQTASVLPPCGWILNYNIAPPEWPDDSAEIHRQAVRLCAFSPLCVDCLRTSDWQQTWNMLTLLSLSNTVWMLASPNRAFMHLLFDIDCSSFISSWLAS